jgi:hypothetical protein
VLGSELLGRAKREPAPPMLASSITAAYLKFRGRTGRVRVLCPRDARCTAKIDDKTVEIDKLVWVPTGQRSVVVHVDGTAQTKSVDVTPEQPLEIVPSARGAAAPAITVRPTSAETASSEAAPPPRERPRGGALPPIVVYVGIGVTILLASTTMYFGIDTAAKHDAFKNAGCTHTSFTDCEDLKTKGEDSQTATNVAMALTAVSALGTAVIGVAFTNWKGPLVGLNGRGGGEAVWRTSF